ncbi:hypothetical protein L596_029514 [Steinernema carpocapsae]|uniref:Uncharacterized protein n=1 Tax=Steinernema carpocapsae TaxID=34508 RepID=A0A4U5LUU6_STECR|nr:hypothetical protein L596_029500 [Steinernema carpocapsae]TKR59907.1 hypothetical protein L596_029514 [Steinernema carpocapsae]
MTGLFELTQQTFNEVINIVAGSLSSWYRVGYALLDFLLTLNRFFAAFNYEISIESDIYKYSIFLMWYALIVLIIMAAYVRIDFHYNLVLHWFNVPQKQLLDQPVYICRFITTAIYVVIIFRLLFLKYKKRPFANGLTWNNLFQTMTLHFQSAFLSVWRRFEKLPMFLDTLIVFTFVYRAIPCLTILVLMVLNRDLQICFWQLFEDFKTIPRRVMRRNRVVDQSVTPVQEFQNAV